MQHLNTRLSEYMATLPKLEKKQPRKKLHSVFILSLFCCLFVFIVFFFLYCCLSCFSCLPFFTLVLSFINITYLKKKIPQEQLSDETLWHALDEVRLINSQNLYPTVVLFYTFFKIIFKGGLYWRMQKTDKASCWSQRAIGKYFSIQLLKTPWRSI